MRHLLTLIFAGLTLAGPSAQQALQKISPALLADARTNAEVPFVVLLTEQADLRAASGIYGKAAKADFVYKQLTVTADRTQRSLRKSLDAQGIAYRPLYIVNALRAQGDLELILAIAQRPEVALIAGDPVLHAPEPIDMGPDAVAGRTTVEWGIDMINADDVWNMGYTGQGVVVGGQDTGYEWYHPALKAAYRGYDAIADTADHNYAWHDAIHEINPLNADSINPCGLDVREPCDDHGHGTHTMGTMIGLDSANQVGVAPGAQWCGCRNMERGWGTPFTYLECFEWFLAPTDLDDQNPDPTKAPHVINNSWSCPTEEGCDSTNWFILDLAVNNLRTAGTVVVVSAGNSGSSCGSVSTPAAMFEGSFSVGATRSNDTIAGFSSRGPVFRDGSNRLKPNVAAPGVSIRSSTPGGNYGLSSGTSMAGPHVAGLVALVISANPELAGQVDLIEDLIEQTAVPKTTDQQCGDFPGSEIPNAVYGYGRVDALAAVEAALALVETSTGETPDAQPLSLYPNPVTDRLHVRIPDSGTKATLDLMDASGMIVLHRSISPQTSPLATFELSGVPAGLYICRLLVDGRPSFGKLIKL